MTKIPVLMVVWDDEGQREQLRADLDHRFGADYAVRACTSAEVRDGLPLEEGVMVAAVIAAARLPSSDRSGIDVLRSVRAQRRDARRILLVDRGEWGEHPVRRAMVLGEVTSYLFVPWKPRERWLYQPMSEYLGDWSLTQPPDRVAVSIVGVQWQQRSHHLRDLFSRASVPFEFLTDTSDAGKALLVETGQDGQRLPVVRIHPGQVLADPTDLQVVEALGFRAEPEDRECDLAIVGAGPSGLSAAVYAPSEGLQTVVLEPSVPGGQAGTSSMIRNYLGFPHGLNGAELTNRALEQAWLFGAEMLLARRAVTLMPDGDRRLLTTDLGDRISARAVVIATGVTPSRTRGSRRRGRCSRPEPVGGPSASCVASTPACRGWPASWGRRGGRCGARSARWSNTRRRRSPGSPAWPSLGSMSTSGITSRPSPSRPADADPRSSPAWST